MIRLNAYVQRRILRFLLAYQVRSNTDLARQIGHSRPSVSRAMNDLCRRGLVVRVGTREWALTDAGHMHAQTVDAKQIDWRARMQRQIERMQRRLEQEGS